MVELMWGWVDMDMCVCVQKVDLYSLGIIFFEMCYRPMLTGMERIKTLTSMRLPTVDLPDDFNELELDKQVCIFYLLCHCLLDGINWKLNSKEKTFWNALYGNCQIQLWELDM